MPESSTSSHESIPPISVSAWAPSLLRSGRIDPSYGGRVRPDRRLGAALLSMRDRQTFRSLGFVHLSDYVIERLGLSLRGAQELMRVEEALTRLPATAAAFGSGDLSSGHVRLLTRAATPETEVFWVGLGRRMGVRELAARVRETAERRKGDEKAPKKKKPDKPDGKKPDDKQIATVVMSL